MSLLDQLRAGCARLRVAEMLVDYRRHQDGLVGRLRKFGVSQGDVRLR